MTKDEIDEALEHIEDEDPWRWWYRFVVTTVIVIMALIALGMFVGPERWVQGNSLAIIHNHSRWASTRIYGTPFAIAAALLARHKTRFAGYTLALFFSIFFVSSSLLFAALNTTAPPSAVPDDIQNQQVDVIRIPLHTNIITLGFSILGILLILAGMRYVRDTQEKARVTAWAKEHLSVDDDQDEDDV